MTHGGQRMFEQAVGKVFEKVVERMFEADETGSREDIREGVRSRRNRVPGALPI